MIQLEEFTKGIRESSMSDDLKEGLLEAAKPCFDFRNHLMSKMGIDDNQAEALIEARVASRAEDINKGLEHLDTETYIEQAVNQTVNVICEFAEEQSFKDIELLKESLIELTMLTINRKIQEATSSN